LDIVPSVAVTVSVVACPMFWALSANVADVDPAAIVTEDGVLSCFALSDRATTTPPEGAGEARVTVQVVLP
jgi:hypothetical protein